MGGTPRCLLATLIVAFTPLSAVVASAAPAAASDCTTSWLVPQDGDLSQPGNWTAGVPSSTATAFAGSGVQWVARTGPSAGRARVSIDGVHRGVVDLYAAAV